MQRFLINANRIARKNIIVERKCEFDWLTAENVTQSR